MLEVWAIVSPMVSALFGGGTVLGFMNWRLSKQRGAIEDERLDDNAVATQMKMIIDAQFESLVQPLQTTVAELRKEVDLIKQQLEEQRTRYWKAIGFIRTMLYWVERKFGEHGHDVPVAPEEIRQDVEIR